MCIIVPKKSGDSTVLGNYTLVKGTYSFTFLIPLGIYFQDIDQSCQSNKIFHKFTRFTTSHALSLNIDINLCRKIIFHILDRNLAVSVPNIHVRIYASINIYCVTYTPIRHKVQTQEIDLYSWACGPILRAFNPLVLIGRDVLVTGNVRDLIKALRLLHPGICKDLLLWAKWKILTRTRK